MKKQVKFSIDEINKIVGQYVFDKGLLGEVKHIDIIFRQTNNPDEAYIVVSES